MDTFLSRTVGPRLNMRGFSLVELMVALTIGMVLLTLLAVVFANSSQSQKEISAAGQQIENGRYAIQLLSEDARHAGFYGYFNSPTAAPSTAPDPCSLTISDIKDGITLPVYGYNSAATNPLSGCLDDDNFVPNTDVLVVRRASTVTTDAGSLDSGLLYIQGTASALTANNPTIAAGSSSGSFTLQTRNGTGANVTAPIRQYQTHIYFVAPCSAPTGTGTYGDVCQATDDGGSPIPTLKRLELSKDGTSAAMVDAPLVEGIENFQVEYGVDSDADGAPNSTWSVDPTNTTAWQNVMAVRMYVLARNTQPSVGYTDSKTYALGSTSVSPGGNYRRHVFETMVRVKNPSERRESP